MPGKFPGYFAGFLGFASDFAPEDQLSDSGKLESCQNGAGMEHQTPSGFLGKFRKRKVLGTLWFPFWFPETLVQAKQLLKHLAALYYDTSSERPPGAGRIPSKNFISPIRRSALGSCARAKAVSGYVRRRSSSQTLSAVHHRLQCFNNKRLRMSPT